MNYWCDCQGVKKHSLHGMFKQVGAEICPHCDHYAVYSEEKPNSNGLKVKPEKIIQLIKCGIYTLTEIEEKLDISRSVLVKTLRESIGKEAYNKLKLEYLPDLEYKLFNKIPLPKNWWVSATIWNEANEPMDLTKFLNRRII